jgi:hypothetical protein
LLYQKIAVVEIQSVRHEKPQKPVRKIVEQYVEIEYVKYEKLQKLVLKTVLDENLYHYV